MTFEPLGLNMLLEKKTTGLYRGKQLELFAKNLYKTVRQSKLSNRCIVS